MPTKARDQGQKELDTNLIKITSLQKGTHSITHYSLVHQFIPMPQALKIPDAMAAVEQEWEKLEKIPAWQLPKVLNEKEVIEEARNDGGKSSFCVIDGSLSS